MTLHVDRRALLKAAAASVAAASLSTPALAQGAGAPVVVIGGGFGGTACARALRTSNPRLAVTLVEAKQDYTAMPHGNAVIAGLADINEQRFGYDHIRSEAIDVRLSAAAAVDPVKRNVRLLDGTTINYERLVVSPGVALRNGSIPGYDDAAIAEMPSAYVNGNELLVLRRQLEAMDDGGTVVITSPVNPARCPPAPYERASLIAYFLKTSKPRSKVVILDSKESFTMQKQFEAAWQALYPGMIEWIGLSQGGELTAVDARQKVLSTDFDQVKAAVANVIPPQRAGAAADIAGVADRTGWCPVNPLTFESLLQTNIHVIGDAAIAGAMPRSASAAVSQGRICAAAIAALMAGREPAKPTLTSSCYSLIAPGYAISLKGTYRPDGDQYVDADGGPVTSPLNATQDARALEAKQAAEWYRNITKAVFA